MAETFREIVQAAIRLGSLADVDEVIKNLSRLLKKTVKSRWALIYFFDRQRRDFTPARSHGLPQRYQDLFWNTPLLPDQLPALKAMLRKKQHLLIADAGSSELLNADYRKLLKSLTLLAVPMVVRNQVTGVVFVARNRQYPPFSAEEITLIRDIVSHAALVVSHIRLFDESLDTALELGKRIEVILTLDEINKSISSSLSREQIIATAMESIERVIQCELAAMLEEEEGELVVTAAHTRNLEIPPALKPSGRVSDLSVAGTAFAKRKSCYIPFLSKVRRPGGLDRALVKVGIESLLAIPLVSKEQVKGVLLLGDNEANRFGSEEAFTIEKIASQMAVALENAHLYEDMRSLFINTVASLANAIDAKSPWTKGHSERVMRVAGKLARVMGLSAAEVERVEIGGLLHDIGKIGIIEALLEKPERLTDDEFPPMRLHPEKGVAILAPIEQLKEVLPGILHHHERYDGKGYPAGLKGENIPLAARLITVADSFDAMVADRPYKKGLSVSDALAELRACAGSQFDPAAVDAFCGNIERLMPNATDARAGRP